MTPYVGEMYIATLPAQFRRRRLAYQVDAGGSVIGITNSSGTEVARYAYDPYGNPLTSQAPGTLAERNPLRYRGYCYDAESGYYHMPARYYDPASARFVSVDPAAPSAGDPVSLNGYSYCFGDPVGLVDPDGREPHGYNMPDGYGEDGYNYGHDDQHSTVPDARAHAAVLDAVEATGDFLNRNRAVLRIVANALIPHMNYGDSLQAFGDLMTRLGDGNIDFNGTYIFVPTRYPEVGLGFTGGRIMNTPKGWGVADTKLKYIGFAAGKMGSVSGSAMRGDAIVEPGNRYIEGSYVTRRRIGGAAGFRSSPKAGDTNPWGINDTYMQYGGGTPGGQLTWFYVWK